MALESKATIGVLDDAGILTYSYALKHYGRVNIFQTFQINTLYDLLTISHALDIDTLWIVPGSRLSTTAKCLLPSNAKQQLDAVEKSAPKFIPLAEHKSALDIYSSSTIGDDGTPWFLLLRASEGNRKSVRLAWPEHDSRWPWAGCTDASTLLKSLLYLQDALEAEIAWGPGHVGQGIIKKLTAKHPTWLAPVELPEVITDRKNYCVDMHRNRPLTAEEQQPGMWLHLFDGNSKFLAACTSANIGEGEPVHFTENVIFQANMPGIWRIGDTWIWTPELEYLFVDMGDRPDIEEAYAWPRYHQALRGWGEHMWETRQVLKGSLGTLGSDAREAACQLAYDAVKDIYVQTHGWFPKKGRPDIWCMIVACALRSTGFKKRQLEQQGRVAVYWKADMLGFVSPGPDRECYHSMLNRAGLLGGYKHVVSGPITPELAAAFAEDFSACDKALGQWRKAMEAVPV